jgi:uncharacterized protein YjbI with pentapeptide repeats
MRDYAILATSAILVWTHSCWNRGGAMEEKPKSIVELKSEVKPESAKQPKSLWQKIKKPLIVVLITIAFVLVVWLVVAITSGYLTQNWDWTGFKKGTTQITITSTSKTNYSVSVDQPYKTLWDWLQLLGILAIPVVVGLGTVLFTTQQANESEKNREKRHKTDLEIADKNREREQETAIQIALDSQHEEILRAYIDKMAGLLLNFPKEVAEIARLRTLTTLEQLDGKRKRIVLQFLYGAHLIDKDKCIISLEEANLKDAELRDIILRRADLKEAYLYGADLRDADLSGTCLHSARLDKAILDNAMLSNADLSETRLPEAKLGRADLSGADLSNASLVGADLTKIRYNKEVIHSQEEDTPDINPTKWKGAKYNTKKIQKKSEKGQPIFDQSGKPDMIEQKTQWPEKFDPKAAEVICVDC